MLFLALASPTKERNNQYMSVYYIHFMGFTHSLEYHLLPLSSKVFRSALLSFGAPPHVASVGPELHFSDVIC